VNEPGRHDAHGKKPSTERQMLIILDAWIVCNSEIHKCGEQKDDSPRLKDGGMSVRKIIFSIKVFVTLLD
jgi:hypothetical protein